MIPFRPIEAFQRNHLRDNRALEDMRLVQFFDVLLGDLFLLFIDVENRRTILRANVVVLAVQRSRVVSHREVDLEQLAVSDPGRIVRNPERLRVTGVALLDPFVVRRLRRAAGVSSFGVDHAFHMFEDSLHAPEAAAGEHRGRLFRRGPGGGWHGHVGRIGKAGGHQSHRQNRYGRHPCKPVISHISLQFLNPGNWTVYSSLHPILRRTDGAGFGLPRQAGVIFVKIDDGKDSTGARQPGATIGLADQPKGGVCLNTSGKRQCFLSEEPMPSILEQYRISDFVEWRKQKRLNLNPDFQRGSVWSPAARTFLIDTILRQLPVPKVYLRTRIDVTTKHTIREVVDGQQRMRAILDFADDGFVLSKRAGEFCGLKYSTMSVQQQERFLSYPIAVDQLVNATDTDVLEVFARLNSYTVTLNPPEKRHARFQGDFKWAVRAEAQKWKVLWETYEILTVRERVRMLDDSLTAEMFGVLLEGVSDGGQGKIDALYKNYDPGFDADTMTKLDTVLKFFVDHIAEGLIGSPLLRPTHFLMLFSALAALLVGIPGNTQVPKVERLSAKAITDNLEHAREKLQQLGSIIDSDAEPSRKYLNFWKASRATTQRIASREVRFPFFVRALSPKIG